MTEEKPQNQPQQQSNQQANPQPTKINVDGKEYLIADLSDGARAQLKNLQVVEAELMQLKMKTAIASTAKNAYLQAFKAELPDGENT